MIRLSDAELHGATTESLERLAKALGLEVSYGHGLTGPQKRRKLIFAILRAEKDLSKGVKKPG